MARVRWGQGGGGDNHRKWNVIGGGTKGLQVMGYDWEVEVHGGSK